MLITNNNSLGSQAVRSSVDSRPQALITAESDESGTYHASASSSVSVLARQLSAAATRAQLRDAMLDLQALGQRATQVLGEMPGGAQCGPDADKSVGSPDSPGEILHTHSRRFQGISRDQLALIVYDEGNEFSTAERVAAMREASSQEQLWRQSATQHALEEYNATGKLTGFFKETLSHFKSLAPIDQGQYPAGYAVDLQHNIDSDVGGDSLPSGVRTTSVLTAINGVLPELAFMLVSAPSERAPVLRSSPTDFSGTQSGSTQNKGRQLMLDRLFGGREPGVLSGVDGTRIENMGRSNYVFLTRQDRELLSDIYSYADGQDIDLEHADAIASEIGDYRRHNNGRAMSNFNNGNCYDSEGWQLTVSFTEKDSATASRLLNGTAINSTRIDQDFLRYILDPGFGALGNTSDLEFLEHVVTLFSAETSTAIPAGSRFSKCVPIVINDNSVLTASKEVRLPKFEPDVVTEDGVSRLTDKGRALGVDLERVSGASGRSLLELVRFKACLNILRQWHDEELGPRRHSWLDSMWSRLERE